VLLLRMTQQRFSATQYALFSSLFSLPRIVAGPIAGFMVDAMGWEAFFWMTLLAGIPGLVILQRFVPLGVREPVFSVEPPHNRAPLSTAALWVRGLAGGGIGFSCGVVVSAGLALLKASRATAGQAVDPAQALAGILLPADTSGWMTLAGLLILGSVCGLMTAAVTAARHGSGLDLGEL
jgi:PAT family beta-lactamase induction signal transducer AmpG